MKPARHNRKETKRASQLKDQEASRDESENASIGDRAPFLEVVRQYSELIDLAITLAGTSQEEALKEARGTISRAIHEEKIDQQLNQRVLAYSYVSTQFVPGYATLNFEHINQIRLVVDCVSSYLRDESRERPLNFLLLASPGSGKSQLIKSIANKLGDESVGRVSFNMATMRSKDDLGRVLDAARNLVIDHKLPIVFLDEFDSDDSNYPLLLPLLWDGELDVGSRELKLGRSVFFLAGSRSGLPKLLDGARGMLTSREGNADDSKLVDLFSRINGTVVELPSLSAEHEDTAPDKVVIGMHLLRRRFRACLRVPRSLLSFIGRVQFRYEARSIATLIDEIPIARGEKARDISQLTIEHLDGLPLHNPNALKASPLAFHLLNDEGVRALVGLWQESKRITSFQELHDPVMAKLIATPTILTHGQLAK